MKSMPLLAILLLLTSCASGEFLGGSPVPAGNQTQPSGTGDPDDPPATSACDFRKGMTFICWYPGCFQDDETSDSLDAIRDLGGNWLAVVHTWYQDTKTSTTIYEHASKSPTDADLRSLIPLAKEKGFSILLKPHVDIVDGSWRGQIDPSNLSAWQTSYREFILHEAELAEELGIETLAIATELKTRSGDTSFWRDVIADIRDVFSGELTYAANWDEVESVAFWDDLDFIGSDFYYPLTDDANATQADMEAALVTIGEELQTFSEEQGKTYLFTEIGYRSNDGTNIKPYDYSSDGTIDEQEQADAYAAVLATYSDVSWLDGLFWWRSDPRLSVEDPYGYLIYEKLAADTLAEVWTQEETCD